MNPCRAFILRPVATTLLMAAIFLSGLLAWQMLPVSALPEVDYPTIQVVTLYPGASPSVITSSITAPLERQFGQMPGLSQMSSTSSSGASVIVLQFSLDLALDIAEQEVQAAINAASNLLPNDLPNPPIYNKVNPADTPILSIAIRSSTLPLTRVADLVETRIAQKLSQVPGVGLVSLSGGLRQAVRIQGNPKALAARGLTLADIRTAIGNANVNQPKGALDGPLQSSTIEANDQLKTIDEYKNLILNYQNGAPVRLRDVATVVDSAENLRLAAWAGTTPAVILNVQRQPGANLIQVTDRIQALLPQLQATLPGAVDLHVLNDRTVTIRASIADVEFELMLAIGLVILVIFAFLRNGRATLIPAIAVPLSLVGTLGVIFLCGFSLNNLTLMALTIATGFVVDDAIVMIENIAHYIEAGDNPMDAALKGSEQIAFTIISLTFSLLAVLIPLLFMRDIIGRLFREFAITLAVSILISALISLTLTPMMCARFLKPQSEQKPGRFARASEHMLARIIDRYGVCLTWVLQHPTSTLLVSIGTILLTMLLYVLIPKGFFPLQDTGTLQGTYEAPQSISFRAMGDQQQKLVTQLLQDPAVDRIASFIGVDGTNASLNSGRLLIHLKPKAARDSIQTVLTRLQRLGASQNGTLYVQPVQDLSIDSRVSRTQYQFSLQATSPAALSMWTPRLLARLQNTPELADVASDLQDHGLQANVHINRDTAARLGITTAAIDNALYDAFGQRLISTIYTQTNQYRVVLEAANGDAQGLPLLNKIFVQTAQGTPVTLDTIAHITQQPAALTIHHLGQFPTTTISFNLARGTSLGEAVAAIRQATQSLNMPASIETRFQGAAMAFQASLSNTLWLILAAVITMYIVLGILYESYIHPITILSTLPSAAIGAFLALMLFQMDLNIIAIIGIILLIGIVKKNAIMMIDFALEAERVHGLSPRDAIYQAGLRRFRPILMTTMAALLGALPLMLGTGMGAELRHPLGVTMVGGLMLSQLLTLFTTPVIYLAFDRLARRLQSFKTPTSTNGNAA